ncbi:MAG: hypothetical protein A2Z31_04800 [candidate division NC10 bacterium RBG_16_65_8]|nr:MAG: hypothetical protein A2Z31_04800 [candidate division NC10 bacterium RBG_16_65_8]
MRSEMVSQDEAAVRSEKHVKRQAAQEARRQERARGARRSRLQRLATRGGMLLLLVGVLGVLGWWILRPQPGTYVSSQGNTHVTSEAVGFRYASDPPTSGPHFSGLASWGIHEQPIPKALQIHNLEDGGVLVQYNCTDCDDLITRLKDVVRRYEDKVALAPYPEMSSRIALTAWSYIDTLDGFDERRIVRFIEAHRGVDHHVRGSF